MKIIINGTAVNHDSASVTYEEVVRLAGEKGNPSVSYKTARNGDSQRSGTMYEGKRVTVEPDMIFNVMHTNKA